MLFHQPDAEGAGSGVAGEDGFVPCFFHLKNIVVTEGFINKLPLVAGYCIGKGLDCNPGAVVFGSPNEDCPYPRTRHLDGKKSAQLNGGSLVSVGDKGFTRDSRRLLLVGNDRKG